MSKALLKKYFLTSSYTERNDSLTVLKAMYRGDDSISQSLIDNVKAKSRSLIYEDFIPFKFSAYEGLGNINCFESGAYDLDDFDFEVLISKLPKDAIILWSVINKLLFEIRKSVKNFKAVSNLRKHVINARILGYLMSNNRKNVLTLKKVISKMDDDGILCDDIITGPETILNFRNIDQNTAYVLKTFIFPTNRDSSILDAFVNFYDSYEIDYEQLFLDKSYPVTESISDIVDERVASINALRLKLVPYIITSIDQLTYKSFAKMFG